VHVSTHLSALAIIFNEHVEVAHINVGANGGVRPGDGFAANVGRGQDTGTRRQVEGLSGIGQAEAQDRGGRRDSRTFNQGNLDGFVIELALTNGNERLDGSALQGGGKRRAGHGTDGKVVVSCQVVVLFLRRMGDGKGSFVVFPLMPCMELGKD